VPLPKYYVKSMAWHWTLADHIRAHLEPTRKNYTPKYKARLRSSYSRTAGLSV